MTKQIRVVNISNWDGEDYEVLVKDQDGQKERMKILKPGESMVICNGGNRTVELVDREQGGSQVSPVPRDR